MIKFQNLIFVTILKTFALTTLLEMSDHMLELNQDFEGMLNCPLWIFDRTAMETTDLASLAIKASTLKFKDCHVIHK